MNRQQQYIEKAANILLDKRNGNLTKNQYAKKVFDLADQYTDVFRRPDIVEFSARMVRTVDKRAKEIADKAPQSGEKETK